MCDGVLEVLESELGPGSAECLDGLLTCGWAVWLPVSGFVDRGGVADRCPDLPDLTRHRAHFHRSNMPVSPDRELRGARLPTRYVVNSSQTVRTPAP